MMTNFGGNSEQAGAPDASLLLIVGADRDDQITRRGTQIRIGGSSDIYGLLDGKVPFHRLHVTRNFFRQHRRPELAQYRCMVNMITEPEQNRQVLDNVRRLLRGTAAKIINRPGAVLQSTRDLVARQLAGIEGLVVPKTVRLRAAKPADALQAVAKAGTTFPIILRQAGTHTGLTVGLCQNAEEIQASLVEGCEHIATEFVDFRSADGLYRKHRVFFIGRQIIFRHMLVSDDWNVHAKDRRRFMTARPDLLTEEEAMFAEPEGVFPAGVLETLRGVRERMKLDFFGMDFGILPDDRVVLFEANASMNFFPFLPEPEFAYVQQCWEPAKRAFRELVGLEPLELSPAAADLESAR